ncbi:MAG TPA: propanediol/glycerol family dehydratase large subunit [Anaerolineales bacterium]|nr:propanediol/glycerol family dehydratase large subunit [Anaerolineales bacterium]
MNHSQNNWARYDLWDERHLSLDRFAVEDPENGFCAAASPHDPKPSLVIEHGCIIEMDGVPASEFDMIDEFIARHYFDLTIAEEAMAIDSRELAHMLVDVHVPRERLVKLSAGMTPAKLAEVLGHLNTLELAFANSKLRCRRQPSNQAHVTNAKDDPVQMAADAATAALYGFDEIETTVRVARNGRTNAIACAVGAAVVRDGVLIQCSLEEAEELRIALAGFTSYTETLSVYGTESSFLDGDDTPWSKAFLTAIYAARGLKTRCTSGSSAELLMGFHEGKSMLYLEARCVCLQRAMGVQGTQNGGIDGAPLTSSVPRGGWELLAENVLAALLDLECASGNDTRHSESEIRVGAKIMPFLMSGTDFICSGFGSIPKYDNSFNASLFNAEELEDFLALQREFQLEGGIQHVPEDELMAARARAIEAICAVLETLTSVRLTEAQKQSVLYAHGSDETASFMLTDVANMNATLIEKNITFVDIVQALAARGFTTEATRLLSMARQRVTGDYLQTAAIIRDGRVVSAVNDPNRYRGPGTGYVMTDERRQAISRMRREISKRDILNEEGVMGQQESRHWRVESKGEAGPGDDPREVVIGISPGFGVRLHKTTGGVPLYKVLAALMEGILEKRCHPRVVRVRHTADTSFLGLTAARLAGSGVGIGIQGKGTTVIHRHDQSPHMNLELFSQAPLIGEADYRAIGANAARYALEQLPIPVTIPYRGQALGARFHVQTALLYAIETSMIEAGENPEELEVKFYDVR